MSAFWCNIWWITLGATLAWCGYWLLDKLFRRDGEAAGAARADYEERIAHLTGEAAEFKSARQKSETSLGLLQSSVDDHKREAIENEARFTALKAGIDRLQGERGILQKAAAASAAELSKMKSSLNAETEKAETAVKKLRDDLTTARSQHEVSTKSLGLL